MVPKVAGKGRSFMGAGLYYLHDKKASTSERVAFTHTENLPTRDPDKAIKCMAYTAIRQQELKAKAGGSTKGRKLTQPVYCYSLSWSPEEAPSQEEMLEAAKTTLKTLGLEEHEALFVGHSDEPHPHIHVIVNRVHPETGIAAKLSKDHLKLSAWAEAYERTGGQIRCEQRVENNERRRQGEFVKDRDSQHAAEFHRWRQERVARQTDKRGMESAVLDARHERQRDQLRIARDQKIEDQRKRFRDHNRGNWRDLYTIQGQERGRLDTAQRNAWTRVRFFIKTHGADFAKADSTARLKMLKGAFAALRGSRSQYHQLEQKQKAERVFFADKLKARAHELTARIRKDHERRLSEMREQQSAQRQEMQSRHSEASQKQAREIREGTDREVYRKERRDKRTAELHENKRDIERQQPEANTRPASLRDRFRKANRAKQREDRSDRRDQPAHSAQASERPAEREPTKREEFREQAQDVTTSTAKPERSGASLSDRFRKAREENPQEASRADKGAGFAENARSMDRDTGRERSKTLKPPGGRKPD